MPKVYRRGSAASAAPSKTLKDKTVAKSTTKAAPKAAPKTSARKSSEPVLAARCFSCRESREFASGSYVEEMANGRKIRRGTCSECGGKMSVMVAGSTPVDKTAPKTASKVKTIAKKTSTAKVSPRKVMRRR